MADDKTSELIERIFWSTYRGAQYSLNPAQWAALRFFAEHRSGGRTSSEFAKFHQTTRGTANQTVLALIRKGYLSRDPSLSDHRSKSVTVTREGRDILKSDPIRPLLRAIDALDPADRRRLETQLTMLYERLRDLQEDAA
ncbi:MAG: MarR family transcriptional regulator [Alphaproteobacteria bacterium]